MSSDERKSKTAAEHKPLGRWHLWWLKQFREAHTQKGPRHGGGVYVEGWGGLPQGKALVGLLDRGLIEYKVGFDGGGAILHITEKGLQAGEINDA